MRVIQGVARWYLRRGRITRIIIFTVIFILPMFLYAHMKVTEEQPLLVQRVNNSLSPSYTNLSTLPEVPFFSLIHNKTIYYIGENLEMYGDNVHKINDTFYIYHVGNGVWGLLVNGGTNDSEVFILTTPVEMNITNISIKRVTLILPIHHVPKFNSTLLTNIICNYVSNTSNPYKAYKENKLVKQYGTLCS